MIPEVSLNLLLITIAALPLWIRTTRIQQNRGEGTNSQPVNGQKIRWEKQKLHKELEKKDNQISVRENDHEL